MTGGEMGESRQSGGWTNYRNYYTTIIFQESKLQKIVIFALLTCRVFNIKKSQKTHLIFRQIHVSFVFVSRGEVECFFLFYFEAF